MIFSVIPPCNFHNTEQEPLFFFFFFLLYIYIYILLISFVVHVQVSAYEARTGNVYHKLVNSPIMYKSHGYRDRLINILQAYTSDCCSVVSRP